MLIDSILFGTSRRSYLRVIFEYVDCCILTRWWSFSPKIISRLRLARTVLSSLKKHQFVDCAGIPNS